ncbi:hypothetical protein [Gemmatimonas sp.]|uniref:hypothetical protein n=1 Tax=Gemmatimonas sp. TaxID=1962908 RepID=UPI003982F681
MPNEDRLIAATALTRDLAVVTRNRTDFETAGVRIIDLGSAQLTKGLGSSITYASPGPWHFYRTLRRDGHRPGLILAMLLLHMLSRFTGTPPVTRTIANLTGRTPSSFAQFVATHREELLARPTC